MYSKFSPWVVRLFTVVCCAVFALWAFLPQARVFMVHHFLVSGAHLYAGYYWTLVTSVFSHNMLFHLVLNLMVLSSFGPAMERMMGHTRFFLFFLLSGIAGSLGHVFCSIYLLHIPNQPALGASGALAGLILLFSLWFPRERILIFGIIPVRAIWGAVGFVSLDLWGLMAQRQGGGLPIGHGAHLGGALFGALYYFYRRARMIGR
jgi:membrane associated rhomboid family serine protease